MRTHQPRSIRWETLICARLVHVVCQCKGSPDDRLVSEPVLLYERSSSASDDMVCDDARRAEGVRGGLGPLGGAAWSFRILGWRKFDRKRPESPYTYDQRSACCAHEKRYPRWTHCRYQFPPFRLCALPLRPTSEGLDVAQRDLSLTALFLIHLCGVPQKGVDPP
ncbi:hypothetical protein BC834DRAFT_296903 [Gloeopeniophorella convolvens]|nr:hypothetical protein BC834DRAFT_296903 [Gloeopeniophorella convolvens]